MVVLVKSRVEKCQQLKRRVAYVCRPPCFPHNLPVTVCGQTKNSAVIHVVRQADQSNQLLVSPCPADQPRVKCHCCLQLLTVTSIQVALDMEAVTDANRLFGSMSPLCIPVLRTSVVSSNLH